MREHTCTDHDPGTPTCRRHCGCRCWRCCTAATDYRAGRRTDWSDRIDNADVAEAVEVLLAKGYRSVAEIARDVGVSDRTLQHVVSNPGTCAARIGGPVVALGDEFRDDTLDPTPLLDALEHHARAADTSVRALVGETVRRRLYRASERGWIDESDADRIACTVLGMPLPLLYGTDYDQEAA